MYPKPPARKQAGKPASRVSQTGSGSDQLDRATAEEQYVANVYRALGYRVTRDVLVNGNQIDIAASKVVPGYGAVDLLVEVKHFAKPVPKEEVLRFLNVSRCLLDLGRFTKAVMVSGSGFTKAARASLEPFTDIELLDLRALEESFLAVQEPLLRYLNIYREKPINSVYIDLEVTLREEFPNPNPTTPRNTAASKLLELAVRCPDAAILLFADYGAGKSTTLERLKATAADSFLHSETDRIPILFILKEFGENADLETYVQETFRREFGLAIPGDLFLSLTAQGRFLLLLDGFDEITLRADSERRADLLRRLSPLLFGGSPAILTSRPSYFVNAAEYRSTLAHLKTAGDFRLGMAGTPSGNRMSAQLASSLRLRYQPAEITRSFDPYYMSYDLDLLTGPQIQEYLDKHELQFRRVGIESAKDVRRFLETVYDLSDLIQRPIILDMAVVTVLKGVINLESDAIAFGPANLYEVYTGAKLEVDWDKAPSRRSLLSPSDRQQFAELCARFMYEHDVLQIEESEVASIARRSLVVPSTSTLDEVLTDLRTCSFLTVSDTGSLRFIHRSFQEFFLARRVKSRLDADDLSLVQKALPQEVLYFLGAFAFSDNEFLVRLLERVRGEGQRRSKSGVGGNLGAAVLYARERLQGLDWKGLGIAPVRRPRLHVGRSALSDVSFRTLSAEDVTFSECDLAVRFRSSQIAALHIESCRGSVHLEGDIEMTSIIDSMVEVRCWPQHSLAVTGGQVSVTCEGKSPGNVRCTDGLCTITSASGAEIRASRSTIELRSTSNRSKWSGRWENCFLRIGADHAAAGLTGEVATSLVVIHAGKRGKGSSLESGRVAPRSIHRSIVLCASEAAFNPRALDLVTAMVFGGRVVGVGRTIPEWRGLMFREVLRSSDPERVASGSPVLDFEEFVEVRHIGSEQISVEGHGRPFLEAQRRLNGALNAALDSSQPRRFVDMLGKMQAIAIEIGADIGLAESLFDRSRLILAEVSAPG